MTKSQLINLLNEMTLDEKIGQLIQIRGNCFLKEEDIQKCKFLPNGGFS